MKTALLYDDYETYLALLCVHFVQHLLNLHQEYLLGFLEL